jgi:ubiquinone/menaquinone biosynthesis C-methylase UbiE
MPSTKPSERKHIIEQQARYFDQVVEVFDQEPPPDIRRALERIVESAALQREESVLDVGAGVGVLIPLFRARGVTRIIACEISPRMLQRLREIHPDVETILSDVCDLKLPDDSLDAAFMNAVFPNIADKPSALANISRMLRVGGRLIISHPEGRAFVDRLREVLPFPLDPLPFFPELRRLIQGLPLRIRRYADQKDLYLVVLEKIPRSGGPPP